VELWSCGRRVVILPHPCVPMSLCPYDPQLHFAAMGSRYGVLSTGPHTVLSKSWTEVFFALQRCCSPVLCFFRPACLGASTMPCRSPMIKHCWTPTRQSFVHQEGDQGMTGYSSCISHVAVCSRSEHSVRLARNYGPSRVLSTYLKFEEGA
jgi:hypothetical protein